MQQPPLDEIVSLSKHFYRLMDPRVSTRDQATVVTTIAGEVTDLLAALYEMDIPTRDVLYRRLRELSDEVMAERQAAVH